MRETRVPCRFPREEIAARPPDLWRYREALPVVSAVTLGEGMTPLLEEALDGVPFLAKCDYRNPTGSFKDRGAAVMVSALVAEGVRAVRADSSGNAGIALAAYGARAGLRVRIFVPSSAPPAKIAPAERAGAEVVRVEGPRSMCAEACRTGPPDEVWAGHARNPWFLAGTRTAAFEISEALGWIAPDAVFVPAGNGTLLLGLARGFEDLREAGVTSTMPRLFAVQPEACCPIAVLGEGREAPREWGATCADGLRVDAPPRGAEVVAAVARSGGRVLTIAEKEILRAREALWRRGHPVCANAAAAAAAAVRSLRGHAGGLAVVLLTGRERT